MAKRNRLYDKNTSEPTNRRGHWSDEIAKAQRRFAPFQNSGKLVVDRYRLERENSEEHLYQDRYNILYSSTETTRPSLYAQTPKVQATKRHRDRANDNATLATLLLETAGQYAVEEIDFDDVINNVVEDYLLPGMGVAWVRYEPHIETRGEGEDAYEELTFEGLDVDYVHYRDFITGAGRVWKELPWIARRVYFNKAKATKRFGAEKADRMAYSYSPTEDGRSKDKDLAGSGGAQAIIWEIWDKENRKVVWYSDDYSGDVLDEIADPLKLKDFWPCPRPLRAVVTTSRFAPKSFYSQYKAQAEELDNITERIRHLTQALRVIGVYDASQPALTGLLLGRGNKMVPVDNWAAFSQQGGMNGAVQYVPIKEVAEVLMQLYGQRDIAKNEIYEITGFSDILRGVSKASETLGAQQIKDKWGGGRLKALQKEVQRFCRDLIRIMTEVISEQFSETSLAIYAGFEPPPITPEEQQLAAQYAAAMSEGLEAPKPPPTGQAQAIAKFREVVKLLKDEKQRCALIGIETDSTIQPDEAAERADRLEFLGQMGAFLQQAGPMAMQYPDMRGLLGAIMMFVVRTFRASRPIEQSFQEFEQSLANAPPMPPPGEGGGSDPAAAQAQVQSEQLKAQSAQALKQIEVQSEQQKTASDAEIKKYEIDARTALEREKLQAETQYKMAELALREREVAVKEAELGIKQQEVQIDAASTAADQARQDQELQHRERMDATGAEQADRQIDVAEKAAENRPKPGEK